MNPPLPLTKQEQADAVWAILEREFTSNPAAMAVLVRDMQAAEASAA